MISEKDRYRSEVFKIAGFGFTAPVGKMIMDIPNLNLSNLNFQFLTFSAIALIALYIGITLLLKGYDIMGGR